MRRFIQLAATMTLLFASFAQADFKPYSKEAYDMAISEGKTVVLDFHASWCPTCKKQEPILNEVLMMKGYENVVGLKVDFDKEKDLKKALNVSKQSTLVVFKSGKEITRKTGLTSKDEIKKLIDSGM